VKSANAPNRHAGKPLVAVFAGAVDPAKLRFPFSHMQETDTRDWEAIDS
jgi:hypothetical protein